MRTAAPFCLLLAGTACATVGGLRVAPINQGDVLHYAVPLDTAVRAVEHAVDRAGLAVRETNQVDSANWTIIATTGLSVNVRLDVGTGELVRVAVQSVTPEAVAVRVLSRPRNAMGLDVRDWSGPIYRELDRELGPRATMVRGSRVRVVMKGGTKVVGTLDTITSEVLVVRSDRGNSPVTIATDSVTRLAVSRGTRTHGRTGAAIGGGVGVVGGWLVGAAIEGSCVICIGPLIGAAAGGLVGGAMGAAAGSDERTEQWWDVALPPRLSSEQ